LGLSTRVAENKTGAVEGSASPGLEKSFGSTMYRIRGTFLAEYDFRTFPYDSQELNVTLQMSLDLPLRKTKIVTRAEPMPNKPGGGDLPLWETVCVTSSTGVEDKTDIANSFMIDQTDPYARYIMNTFAMSPAVQAKEFFAHNDMKTNGMDESATLMAEYHKWSTATLTIVVKRLPDFYIYNFVVIVVLLVLVSFFSFHIR